ncbi:hypothetical protein [Actinacidiphila alni]|uniref:hypothetical protein n=1 Tax=Actinacidiphila alni TaxID=380248 RepID=UPI001160A4FD|nr:hypothetical protein [Actinacidiphila alni]
MIVTGVKNGGAREPKVVFIVDRFWTNARQKAVTTINAPLVGKIGGWWHFCAALPSVARHARLMLPVANAAEAASIQSIGS